MRRLGLLVVLGGVLLSGCGGGADKGSQGVTGVADGNYEVGKDIEPGVYTGAEGCRGTIASKPGYTSGPGSNADDFLGGSVQVGNLERVELEAGQFFTSRQCPAGWRREAGAGARTPDPATRAGACRILTGTDDLVAQAVAAAGKPILPGDEVRLGRLQEKLFAVVLARPQGLWSAAGQLVDLLDDPEAYVQDGTLSPSIARARDKIHQVCRNR